MRAAVTPRASTVTAGATPPASQPPTPSWRLSRRSSVDGRAISTFTASAALCIGGLRRRRTRRQKGSTWHRRRSSAMWAGSGEPEYPWSFEGRVRFRPALIGVPEADAPAPGLQWLSIFGVTLGGSVCLEYDTSPVGPYYEVVQMTSVVGSSRLACAGQFGERLMVSSPDADGANGDIWGVPSELKEITYSPSGDAGVVVDSEGGLQVGDWECMRFTEASADRYGPLPIWWTPTIKALWLPLSLLRNESVGGSMPLRRLRLSARGLRIRWAPCDSEVDTFQGPGFDGGRGRTPLPFVIEADGLLIEIGEKFDSM